MTRRTRIAALFAVAGLLSMAASTTIAAAPTYFISVSKTASPTSVPPSGGTVVFTVWVTGTGTGFFQSLHFTDSMGGCSLAFSSGDTGSDGKLSQGETWAYTCSVDNVMPDDTNSVTVNACHATTACTSSPDASGSGQVTLGTGAATEAPPTEAPPTEAPPTEAPPTEAPPTEAPPTEAPPTEAPPTEAPPTEAPPTEAPPTGAVPSPSAAVGDINDNPSPASTDTDGIAAGPHGPDLKAMLILFSILCFLVSSIIVMTPAATKAEAKARS